MSKKRKSIGHHRQNNAEPSPTFDSPFRVLKKLLKQAGEQKPAAPPEANSGNYASEATAPPADERSLFLQAVEGARPIARSGRARVSREPRVSRAIVSEDAEVLAELYDLISGQSPFELTETEEYVEGARVGLDPRLVVRLRKGEFAVQAYLDLHGMVQGAARAELTRFILESVRKGLRTVLVVHGRGRRSPDRQPVLKHAVAQWLSHGTLSGYVLAFTTARAQDGGAGAMCVLLRRQRRRAPFDVLRGAARHRE